MKIAVFAFAVLAAFAALVLLTTPAYCQDAGKAASFTDDMEKLTTAVKLTDDQKKKIETLKIARDAAVEKWNTANQKKVDAAQKKIDDAKDDKAKAPLERSLKATMAGRDKIYADADKSMFAVLTKEQKGTWNGGILNDAATADLANIDPALTDAQTKKIAEICKTKGETMASPIDSASMTAGLAAFMAPIVKQVLLPAQQKDYAKNHKPEPKPKAGAPGSGAGQ
jgi:archaellin